MSKMSMTDQARKALGIKFEVRTSTSTFGGFDGRPRTEELVYYSVFETRYDKDRTATGTLEDGRKVELRSSGHRTNRMGRRGCKHRIFIQCVCGEWIPVGRISQHAGSAKCKSKGRG